MKLYYSPGACSLSPHIALREAGLPFELVLANLQSHQLADGSDYYAVHAKGYVPLLELDDGQRLGEGPVIVQYIADLVPEKNLAPANGTWARYRMQEWLNFTTSELHKGFGILFTPGMPEEAKTVARTRLLGRLAWVDAQLADRQFLMGDDFSVADGYLFNVTNWSGYAGVEIGGLANLAAYRARVAARPAVQAAMRAEGLLK
ncbi:glutathione transferase GstA [soil metagenome]